MHNSITSKRLGKFIGAYKSFFHSIWLFPAILFTVVCLLAAFRISGTSVGAYRQLLYGVTPKDPSLILGQPQPIRSDEWLVNTQMTVAQAKAGYPHVNPNIGDGEDMSLMNDVPYKDWSSVFRPQNLVFFVLPLENAFAFKWWLIGALLVASCYFFVLKIAPEKKLIAICISVALLFSAFVQWWYLYGTIGPLYYSFFIVLTIMGLFTQKQRWKKMALGALLTYLLVCFGLVLYPPFQIPCILVVAAFTVGYLVENYSKQGKRQFVNNMAVLVGSCILALVIFGIFLSTRSGAVKAIENTAYPGTRSINSGGVNPDHFLASQLGHQFISPIITSKYLIDNKSPSNQSEISNFLLLIPFLALPSYYLIYKDYKRKRPADWILISLNLLFIVFLFELFVPAFTPISRLLLLNKVGAPRSLIGIGLLNIIIIIMIIRNISKSKQIFGRRFLGPYFILMLAIEIFINFHAHSKFVGFLGLKHALLLSIPLPLVVYLILKKRFSYALIIYLLFSLYIALAVNPLYRGLGALTKNPLNTAVEKIGSASSKRWVSDGGYLENLALINGEPSVSGTYGYPQFSLWKSISNVQQSTYNRYAHVGFELTDNESDQTSISLIGADSFVVKSSGCSKYLHNLNVGFFVTTGTLSGKCFSLQKSVALPARTFNIYSINH